MCWRLEYLPTKLLWIEFVRRYTTTASVLFLMAIPGIDNSKLHGHGTSRPGKCIISLTRHVIGC